MEAWAEYRYVPDRFNNNIRCIEIKIAKVFRLKCQSLITT